MEEGIKKAKPMSYETVRFTHEINKNKLMNETNPYRFHNLIIMKNALDAKENTIMPHVRKHNDKKNTTPIETTTLDNINRLFNEIDMRRLFVARKERLLEANKIVKLNDGYMSTGSGPRFIMEILRMKDQELSDLMLKFGIIPEAVPTGEL